MLPYMIYLKKDDDHVYAYQGTSYRDPITRKPKSRRVYIGRVDPITKELLNPENAKKLEAMSSNEKKNTSLDTKQTVENSATDSFNGDCMKELKKLKEMLQSQQKTINAVQKEQKEIRKLFGTIERAIRISATQE